MKNRQSTIVNSKLKIVIPIFLAATASGALLLNSFNSGQLGPIMKYRVDTDKRSMGSEVLENILIRPQGMAYKRPGTEFIDWRIREVNIPTTTTVGEYPTLQELTAGEIPDTPATPSDTALAGESNVTNKTELQAMNGANHYILTTNIDCSGGDWTPIADFNGVIDGAGYTISNLTIDGTSDVQGMFSSLDTGTEIRDLNFEDCNVVADDVVGLLAASIDDDQSAIILQRITFTNCNLQGQFGTGFLVGQIGSVGNGSHSNRFYDCAVINCTMTVDESSNYNGMLIGYFPQAVTASGLSYIVRCYSQGGSLTVETDGEYNSAFIGFISSTAAYTTGGHLYDCYTTTDIIADGEQYQLGSFCGKLVGWDVVSCYATGDVSMTVAVGTAQHNGNHISAFIALHESYEYCINSYSTGDITIDGSANVDGFTNMVGYIGCFVGEHIPITDSNMLRCYSTGDITLIGEIRTWHGIGCFIGHHEYFNVDTNDVLIQRCWSQGDITLAVADRTVDPNGCGAFIGAIENTRDKIIKLSLLNCYTWGSITYTDNSAANVATGGMIGNVYETQDANLVIDNCYCAQTDTAAGSGYTSQIPITGDSGGFLGRKDTHVNSTYTIADTFYDQETSGFTTDNGSAVNHTTSWLQTRATFEAAGWDFNTIWILEETPSTTYELITFDNGGEDPVRFIPSEHSVSDAYVMEFGHKYIGFLRTIQ